MTDKFDFDEALKAIQSGQAISGKDGVLAPLICIACLVSLIICGVDRIVFAC